VDVTLAAAWAAASVFLCSPCDAVARDADVRSAATYYGVATQSRQVWPRHSDRPDAQSSLIADATATLAAARAAEETGDWDTALRLFTRVCDKHSDLALVHKARLQRALLLFQTSQREQALLELEDELVDVGMGNAEIHAALAVVLHATRPAQVGRAEDNWDIATRYAPRFADAEWVRTTKGWPPAMLASLSSFLTLT